MILTVSLVASLTVAARFWAAESDPFVQLTTYGPLGLIVLGFITGWIVPGPQAKQQAAEISRLQDLFESEVLPMAKTYAETIAEVTSVLERVLPVLEKAIDAVARRGSS